MLGPYLQAALVVLVGGETSEIYDGLRKYGIEGIAAYWDHFASLASSPLLICGICTAAIMAAARKKFYFLTLASLSMGLGWTVIDLSEPALRANEIFVSIICNIAGGFALALFSYVIHVKFAVLRGSFGVVPASVVRLAWLLWPPVTYFILSFSIFLSISFLIKIPTEQVSITLKAPLKGYYWVSEGCVDDKGCVPLRSEANNFGLLEELAGPGTSSLEIQNYAGPVSVAWRKNTQGDSSVQLRIAQGCVDRKDLEKLIKFPSTTDIKVSSLGFTLDEGFDYFRHFGSSALGRVKLEEPDEPVAFHLNPSKDSEKIELDRFISKGNVKIEETVSRHDYNFGMVMFDSKGKIISARNRSLLLKTSGKNLLLNFQFSGEKLKAGDDLRCEIVKVDKLDGVIVAKIKSPIANLIISVPAAETVSFLDMRNGEWEFKEVRGWVSAHDWPSVDRGYVKSGTLKQISVSGLVKNLQVSDFSLSDQIADIRIAGDLIGHVRGDSISFTGDARYIDVDGHRRMPTRWEALDVGYKIPILLGVPTGIWFALQLLINSLRQSVGRVWRPFKSYL